MHSQTARAPKAHDAGVRARDRTGFALNVALKLAYPAVILGAWLWHAPRLFYSTLAFSFCWRRKASLV